MHAAQRGGRGDGQELQRALHGWLVGLLVVVVLAVCVRVVGSGVSACGLEIDGAAGAEEHLLLAAGSGDESERSSRAHTAQISSLQIVPPTRRGRAARPNRVGQPRAGRGAGLWTRAYTTHKRKRTCGARGNLGRGRPRPPPELQATAPEAFRSDRRAERTTTASKPKARGAAAGLPPDETPRLPEPGPARRAPRAFLLRLLQQRRSIVACPIDQSIRPRPSMGECRGRCIPNNSPRPLLQGGGTRGCFWLAPASSCLSRTGWPPASIVDRAQGSSSSSSAAIDRRAWGFWGPKLHPSIGLSCAGRAPVELDGP